MVPFPWQVLRLVDPIGLSHTMVAHISKRWSITIFIPIWDRFVPLSVREAARIQSFPDDFLFRRRTNSCFQANRKMQWPSTDGTSNLTSDSRIFFVQMNDINYKGIETARAEPEAALMIETFRSIGYTVETAIADIVDNSITAKARKWSG